jgi:hypothetical protein
MFRQSRERSEGDVKVTRVGPDRFGERGRRQREDLGDPDRKRFKVAEGAGKSNDRLPRRTLGDLRLHSHSTPRRP